MTLAGGRNVASSPAATCHAHTTPRVAQQFGPRAAWREGREPRRAARCAALRSARSRVGSCAALALRRRRARPAGGALRQGSRAGAGSSLSAPVAAQGAVSVVTGNTSRIGGSDPASDAAAVARPVYPGLTPATRPQAVVLVDEGNLQAALAASVLASAPLGAPLLFSRRRLAARGERAGARRHAPARGRALGGAQVIASAARPRAGRPARARRCAAPRPRRAARPPPTSARPQPPAALQRQSRASPRRSRPTDAGDRRRRRRAAGARDAGRRPRRRERRADPVRHRGAACPPATAQRLRHCTTRRSTSSATRSAAQRRRSAAPLGTVTTISGGAGERPAAKPTPTRSKRDRDRALHRRHLRLGRQRTGPRARVRQRRAAARRARRGAALGEQRLRAAAAARKPRPRSRRRWRTTSPTSSPPTPAAPHFSPSTASTITAG